MCSFHFSTKKPTKIEGEDGINFFLQKRGPDKTNIEYEQNHIFIHNLLSLTGSFTVQPLKDDGIYLLFNGEIYNYKELGDYDNDSKCIIPAYRKWGIDFPRYLDGEFAITLVDYNQKIVIVTTDVFSTKPLWIARENNEIGAASYESSLLRTGFSKDSIRKMPANTTRIYSLDSRELVFENTVYDFNLDQYKTNFDDWNSAFQKAMKKRCATATKQIFIGLSSGYDSGAIACELIKQKVRFNIYSLTGTENEEILRKRWDLCESAHLTNECFTPQKSHLQNVKSTEWLKYNVEEFMYRTYTRRSDYNEFNLRLHDDNGSIGLTTICDFASNGSNNKIFISGQGADEIFSDYGHKGTSKYSHSNFGGLFPEDLTKNNFFPWPSFFGSSMQSYLCKEEYIVGNHGFESRYPFLDKQVIQEFLNLTCELKNSRYKSVLDNYLTINNFPFARDQKIGF